MSAYRTIRTVKLIVETSGMTEAEHDRRVTWAEKNVMGANQDMLGAFVAVVILDDNGKVVRFVGNGTPTPETEQIIRDLMEEDDGDPS